MRRPEHIPDRWADDPAYASSHDPQGGFHTSFPNLLMDAELWLPADFNLLCETRSPASGRPIVVGSAVRLQQELAEINIKSWRAPARQLLAWGKEGPPRRGRPLEAWARFGFSVVNELCLRSNGNRLPMLLDY